MNSVNLGKLSNKVLEYSFYLLFFLVPLVMTPWNFELFEFNKMMLTYALTAIIAGTWFLKMVLEKKIIFRRTPLEITLLLFFISQLLSTLFSVDRHTSFFGYYSRFHGGLFSTISYLILYFAFVSNFDKQKTLRTIRFALGSASLVAFYGILEHFGIDAKYWVQDVKNRVFSTLGQPNWLAAYLAALGPIPLAFLIDKIAFFKNQSKFKIKRLFGNRQILINLFLFLAYCLCLFFTKSRSGIPAAFLSLAFFFFLLFLPKILTLKKKFLVSSVILFFIFLFAAGFWGTKTLFKNTISDISYILGFTDKIDIPLHEPWQPGSESGDIRKVVWRGAIKIWKAYPILGSGVETFAYSYYNFRPREHNFVSEWDFLYNKAHNEYLNYLATTGLVGLTTYLLFIITFIIWFVRLFLNIKNPDRSEFAILVPALFAGWTSILVTNFFGFSVVPVAIFFFLYPAMIVVLTRKEEQEKEKEKQKYSTHPAQYLFCGTILFAIGYLIFTISRLWYADTLYARSNRFNKQGLYEQAHGNLQKAISLNPKEPLYHDELAWNLANLAVLAHEQNQSELANQLAQLSLNESDKALKVSPRHLNFLKTRAKIYYRLYNLDPSYLQAALQILLRASELAPTDAKIFYNLGLVYYQLGQKQEAIQAFQKTLFLKPNYQEAQTALELILKENK